MMVRQNSTDSEEERVVVRREVVMFRRVVERQHTSRKRWEMNWERVRWRGNGGRTREEKGRHAGKQRQDKQASAGLGSAGLRGGVRAGENWDSGSTMQYYAVGLGSGNVRGRSLVTLPPVGLGS